MLGTGRAGKSSQGAGTRGSSRLGQAGDARRGRDQAGDDSETQRAGRETAMAGARNRAAGIYAQYACHGSCTG